MPHCGIVKTHTSILSRALASKNSRRLSATIILWQSEILRPIPYSLVADRRAMVNFGGFLTAVNNIKHAGGVAIEG
jgi:hypothetical protein